MLTIFLVGFRAPALNEARPLQETLGMIESWPACTKQSQSLALIEAKPGGFQTRVFPTFFGKGPDCVADPFGTVPRRCS